jgi:potassium/hydrogen antiporter
MTIPIIICSLLLIAYLFDITAAKTKVPSVILLLLLGWAVKQAAVFFDFKVPDLSSILPVLGTIGLILIVMEGSLELELNTSKLPFVAKSAAMALLPMLLLSFSVAFAFQYFSNASFKIGLSNAIPLAIISSCYTNGAKLNCQKQSIHYLRKQPVGYFRGDIF